MMSNTRPQLRSITIVAICAALLSTVFTFVVCRRTSPFYFEVSVTSSAEGTAQIYYDLGKGIEPATSAATRLLEGRSVVRLPLPAGEYRSIRFDPIDHGYCKLSLEHPQIVNLSGEIEREFSTAEFTSFIDMQDHQVVDGRIDAFVSAAEND